MQFDNLNRLFFISASLFLLLGLLYFDSYFSIYLAMFIFLYSSFKVGSFFSKTLSLFLIFYLGIALLDISNYRGEIFIATLKAYAFMALGIFTLLRIMDFFLLKQKSIRYSYLNGFTGKQRFIVMIHLSIVYVALIFVYLTKGNVLLHQDLRFGISPAVGYIIKSSIYIPLVYWAARKEKKRNDILIYVFAPLAPSLLIGSRGTVLMIIMGILLMQYIQSRNFPEINNESKVEFKKSLIAGSTVISLIFLYGTYYIRRLSLTSNFLTPSEALNEYFYSDSWVGYIVMPLHLAFKETFGLTNRIIIDNIDNVYTSFPLFIADLVTILPGKQIGAGEAMAEAFGAVAAGGLTPGIVGGLYIDFGLAFIAVIICLVSIIRLIEEKSHSSDKWLIIFALSFVQFLHLFHRGFVKPEYIFAYIITIFYIFITPTFYRAS